MIKRLEIKCKDTDIFIEVPRTTIKCLIRANVKDLTFEIKNEYFLLVFMQSILLECHFKMSS